MREASKNGEKWFDKKKSGYWRQKTTGSPRAQPAATGSDEVSDEEYEFDWCTFLTVLITQGMPPFAGMIIVGQAFKLAFMAQINQGCITVMFGLGSILVAITFYFGLGQTISYIKIFGMLLMIGAGVFLSMDEKHVDEDDESGMSAEDMSRYGYYAVAVASIPPVLWAM